MVIVYIWYIIIAACILVTCYAIIRKGLASLPLVLGIWLLIATSQLLVHWFPPTPPQIALCFFMTGIALTLIVWGLYNFYINAMFLKLKPVHITFETKEGQQFYFGIDVLSVKPPYAVMYGLIPWDSSGAKALVDFLNKEVWGRGLAIRFFEAEHTTIGGIHVAFIFGIIMPKTILDRILY